MVVDRLRTDGQSAILNSAQFAALRDQIVVRTGSDILTAPATISISGSQTHVAVQDLSPIVTGVEAADVSPTNTAGIHYLTDDVFAGFAVDIVSTAEDADKWRLRVLASMTKFLSYENHDKKLAVAGIGYVISLPHFRVVEAGTEDIVPLGQTLAIRGPLWTETTKTNAHFFARAKTKATRQRLYIFVTPTRPPADSH